jgi:hypothetical protein
MANTRGAWWSPSTSGGLVEGNEGVFLFHSWLPLFLFGFLPNETTKNSKLFFIDLDKNCKQLVQV